MSAVDLMLFCLSFFDIVHSLAGQHYMEYSFEGRECTSLLNKLRLGVWAGFIMEVSLVPPLL